MSNKLEYLNVQFWEKFMGLLIMKMGFGEYSLDSELDQMIQGAVIEWFMKSQWLEWLDWLRRMDDQRRIKRIQAGKEWENESWRD